MKTDDPRHLLLNISNCLIERKSALNCLGDSGLEKLQTFDSLFIEVLIFKLSEHNEVFIDEIIRNLTFAFH